MMPVTDRTPGMKLVWTILVAAILAIPLFTVWLLVYDRETQSATAIASISEGWGGPQVISGPELVIPYMAETSETVEQDGRPVTRTRTVRRELALAPEEVSYETQLDPERRRRSIYEAVVYVAATSGEARFTLPSELERLGIERESLALDRAEIRFGLSDMRGIRRARIRFGTEEVELQSGAGSAGPGLSGFVDATPLAEGAETARFAFSFRGNQQLSLLPHAGSTRWQVASSWPHPSFGGGFLPEERTIGEDGFSAAYHVTNLALGRSLVDTSPQNGDVAQDPTMADLERAADGAGREIRVDLFEPVDLYSRVDRSVKYGFLIIGFTFLAYLMFDVIAGIRVSAVEYLLVGAGLVLFFVMLLGFAEVIGFGWAFLVAAGAIIGLITSYSAAILGSWRRAAYIGGLLTALYVVMFILLSLEEFSLLIGSLLLFAALATVMYATRGIDWSARRPTPAAEG